MAFAYPDNGDGDADERKEQDDPAHPVENGRSPFGAFDDAPPQETEAFAHRGERSDSQGRFVPSHIPEFYADRSPPSMGNGIGADVLTLPRRES